MIFRLAALMLLPLLLFVSCDDGDGGDGGVPGTAPTSTAPAGASATFSSGVASGDTTDAGAVLWTRADGGDSVTVEVATDPQFSAIVETMTVETSAARDFTVKAQVTGLNADARYYYRFRAGDGTSDTGTFTTAPVAQASEPLRFVFSGDSDGSRDADGTPVFNNMEVFEAAAAEAPAFFLYFGDTIYADRDPVATTLEGYRGKYAAMREYATLRGILARMPAYVMWDDHEVVNDFAGATVDPAMFAAGRQAFREWMPIAGADDASPMYRSFRWGADIELIVLDQRSYRDDSAAAACTIDGNPDPLPTGAVAGAPEALTSVRAFAGLPATLPGACIGTIEDPARTLLGAEQKAFLFDRLRNSDATWKIVVNPVAVQAMAILPYDRWEGYAFERREVLEFIRGNAIDNVVFLTTDFHANIFGPVRLDPFGAPDEIAYEAVVGPIATVPLEQDIVDAIGEGAAGLLDSFLLGIIKVDCAVLDSYAYGVVAVDPDAGTLTIEAKDATGRVLCEKTLEAK